MFKRRKIVIVLIALLGMVLVGLGIHFRPSSPRLAELGDYRVSTDRKTFEIGLASNSSTGYFWIASDVNSEVTTLEDVTYHTYPSKSDTAGSSDYGQLIGRVTKSGKRSFRLTYYQDWGSGKKEMTYQVVTDSTKSKINKIKLTEVPE